MSVDDGAQVAAESPLKRKRDGQDDQAESSNKTKAEPPSASASASQLASGLKTASPDTLRIALTSLRQATQIQSDEDPLTSIAAKDKRLQFAREFLQEHNGRDRIFEAWQRVHETGIGSLMPLPIFVLSNLITLTSVHPTDNDLSLSLIQPIAPTKSADVSGSSSFWNRLHGYLLNPTSRHGSQQQQGGSGGSSEILVVASLHVLTSMARFESGRFARSIVENLAWNAKSVLRLTSMRRRSGKDQKGKAGASGAQPKAAATFTRPDIRLLFIQLLLVILHPRILPEIDSEGKQPESVDSGVSPSTKMLLINADHAQSSLSSIFKTLADDPPSVVLHFLHVLDRSLLLDSKLPRGALVSLAKSVDLLSSLVQFASKSSQVERLAMEMLHRLCSQPGRGVCFKDAGWYGRAAPSSRPDGEAEPGLLDDDEAPRPTDTANRSSTSGIHNPMIGFFIQSQQFSPLYNDAHRDLLMAIMRAAPELQPVFFNSTRTVFGAGRLEPPLPEAGARLSGLLANRLMGLLLDLGLPRIFDATQPPATGRLISAVFPHTLARANLIKGLRHPDRLVRWSTLDLLSRLLGRVGRMLAVCARFARQDEGWQQAGRALLRECAKRLPDLSTIMSASEQIATPAKGNSTATAPSTSVTPQEKATAGKIDWVLLEGSLRSGLRYMRLTRRRFGGGGVSPLSSGGYDFRNLLSAPYLTNAFVSEDASEAKELLPLIQLHAIKMLRLAKLQLASTSGSDSVLAQVVELLMSPENSPEARAEAASLLKEAFGSVAADDPSASSAALTFEGDQGEFEAWIAALPTGHDETARARRATAVALLEECLSRCSKNTYRYLEAARSFNTELEESDTLCVSPLFATFAEQLAIKMEKGLFPNGNAQEAVLQYLRRLMPLLIGRSRPGAQGAMLAFQGKLVDIAAAKAFEEKQVATIKGTRSVIDWGSALEENESKTVRAETLSAIGFDPEDPASYPSLLLATPSALSEASALPPCILLMQAHRHLASSHRRAGKKSKSKLAVDHVILLTEDAPMAKLSLRLIAELLALPKRTPEVNALLLRCLDHTLAAADLPSSSLGQVFFDLPQLRDAVEHCDAKLLAAFANILAERLDSARAGVLRDWVSSCADKHGLSAVTRPLVPFMDDITLDRLWSTSLQGDLITGGVEELRMLREIDALRHTSSQSADAAQLLALGSKLLAHDGSREELVALLLSIVGKSQASNSSNDHARAYLSAQASVGKLDLQWLTPDLPGADALQSLLIYRFHDGLELLSSQLATKSGGQDVAKMVESMPLSVLAWLDVQSILCEASDCGTALQLDELASPLASLAFHPDPTRSVVAGDALGLLYLLSSRQADKTLPSSVLSVVLSVIPNKPGDAFTAGALRFGASLLSSSKTSSTDAVNIAQRLLEQSLLWLVRRFAEDEEDSPSLLTAIDAFGSLLYRCAAVGGQAKPVPHLADPAIEAAFKRRLTQRKQMDMVRLLVLTTDLKPSSAAAHTAALLAHSQFRTAAAEGAASRGVLVSILHSLASQHAEQVVTPQNLQALLGIYGGTMSLPDRQLFDLFQMAGERLGRGLFPSLARSWSADGTRGGQSSTTALDALLSLDSGRAFSTCAAFPRDRAFEHLSAGAVPSGSNDTYDPLWVLTLLSGAMQQQSGDLRITGLEWLAIVRTNALGVAIVCLSSKQASTRNTAANVIARAYAGISGSDVQEKQHLMLNMDVVRSLLSASQQEEEAAPLPLTTTLFLAHHLRLVGSPSSVLFPPVSRFLLQRPTFDSTDVPMLYATLQSTDPDHWRAHRLWMLRFLRDVSTAGGVGLEWRVLKRRYVWDLLASMYTALKRAAGAFDGASNGGEEAEGSSSTAPSVTRQTLRLVEETMLALVNKPRVASELLTRKGLLTWILQQITLEGKGRPGRHAATFESNSIEAGNEQLDQDHVETAEQEIDANFKLLLLRHALGDKPELWDRLDRTMADVSWTSTVLAILDGMEDSYSSTRHFIEVLCIVAMRQASDISGSSRGLLLRLLGEAVAGLQARSSASTRSALKGEVSILAGKILESLLTLREGESEEQNRRQIGAYFAQALGLAVSGDEQRWRREHVRMLHS
ncbi:hypothetical protein BDZ90DRAFT_31535 [Jaminaea rosea]|uniref:Nucleolar pre-ribosomal-associated protein 1 n=1 Tax=Jaminaea rosea TaxID=1569628 RepID=A0A316V0E4_9BASI|nr:hypothetical protein BDZ90DRAFT_31535 [Jaminaea rosea]PWN31020.1 hypothetical protein BDZ90DRAFT_31535 [Jaminaea rosea]